MFIFWALKLNFMYNKLPRDPIEVYFAICSSLLFQVLFAHTLHVLCVCVCVYARGGGGRGGAVPGCVWTWVLGLGQGSQMMDHNFFGKSCCGDIWWQMSVGWGGGRGG